MPPIAAAGQDTKDIKMGLFFCPSPAISATQLDNPPRDIHLLALEDLGDVRLLGGVELAEIHGGCFVVGVERDATEVK